MSEAEKFKTVTDLNSGVELADNCVKTNSLQYV